MKRFLIANDYLVGGGVENVLENLVRYLLQQGNKVTLMIPDVNQKEVQDLFGDGVSLYPTMRTLQKIKKYSLLWFWDRGLYVLQKLLYCIRFFFRQFDVLIALKDGPTMRDLAGLYGKKKIAWVHTDFLHMHWTKCCFHSDEEERKCMMKFDNVVCVSKASADSVVKTIGDPGNLCVKYNPMNYREIVEKASSSCMEIKNTDGPLFVSVGRLAFPKNYSLLVDVCKQLTKKYNFELWIIGDGPDRSEVQKRIDDYKLKNIKLLGNQTNPYCFLKRADVFVSTSICESYGLAIQEALILGIPVVAIECPAIRETLDTGFGLLVDNDFDALYAAMEKIILQPKLCEEYRENIKQYYDLDDLYEKRLQSICTLWEE